MTELTVVGGKRKRVDGRSKRVKLAAVLAAESSGVVMAERQTGIPESTIRYWLAQPEFAQLRAKTRADLAEEYKVAAHITLQRVVELVPTMEPRDAIFAAEKAATMLQLLSGGVTSRTETLTTTDALDDHEKAALRAVLESVIEQAAEAPS